MSALRVFTEREKAEIKRSYENAADKKKQVGILAELHACSQLSIEIALGMKEMPEVKLPEQKPRRKRSDAGVPRKPKEKKVPKAAEKNGEEIIKESLDNLLKKFDRNEERMKVLRQQMLPLVKEYREITGEQIAFVEFIEKMCDIRKGQKQ